MTVIMDVVGRFFEAPKRGSYFLFGPRGTGKSTWLERAHPDAIRVDLLQPESERELSARPERLTELIGKNNTGTVVIDEIQRVPELLPLIHSIIEKNRQLRFVLTGSSARKLKRTGADLLGGRALVRRMHPFLAAELGDRFSMEGALVFGLIPLILAADDAGVALRSYTGLYVREEVHAEGLVRNTGSFSRFLEMISFSQGAILSIASIARDCHVGRKAIQGYLEILEDLLLSFTVPVFTRKAKRKLTAHSKFYYADVGVYRSLRPRGPLDRPEEIAGAALEGLVAQHLRAWIDYSGRDNNLFFWRTRAGTEVDLVVYGEDGIWGIEVKNTGRIRPEDLRGLRSFRDEYPSAHTLLLYRGAEILDIGGIRCIPCDSFLRGLDPGSGIADPAAGGGD